MLAVSMGLILPSEAQAQGSSTPSGPVAKKAAAKKPEAGPNPHAVAAAPSCKGGELVALHQLTAKDVETLKGALAAQFEFNCLRFSVASKDQNKICVAAVPKDPPACTTDFSRAARSVAVEFDRPVFSGQDGLAAYLVSLPRIGAETIAKAFAESNPDLSLQPASPFLVIVPKAAASAEIKDAAGLKHDFEGIDRIYSQGQAPTLTNGDSCLETDQIQVERWLQDHTVLLSTLHVRDVVLHLKLPTEFVFHTWPRSNSSALSIVPASWTTQSCFAPAVALNQEILFSQAKGEKATAPKKDNAGAAAARVTPALQPDANQQGKKAKNAQAKTPANANASADKPKDKANKKGDQKKADSSQPDDTSDSPGSKPDTADDPPADPPPSDTPTPADSMGEFFRLYHFRQARELEKILDDANGVRVKAVGDTPDVLLISGGTDADQYHMRQLIARLDLPRPQLSLQVWSYQASSEEKDEAKRAGIVQDAFKKLRTRVNDANDAITASLEHGVAKFASLDKDKDFNTYLTSRYKDCVHQDHYCLGFYDALVQPNQSKDGKDAKASLTRMLLLLAAVTDDDLSRTGVTSVIDAMKLPTDPTNKCTYPPDFPNLRTQLELLAEKGNLHALRVAILDFLFIYKQSLIYKKEFVPYDLQKAAHDLDSLMGPVLDAFNQDVDPYVNCQLKSLDPDQKANGFVSSSSLQVTAISGTQAAVSGKVNNYFDITPPLSLADLLKAPDQNVKDALTNILKPKEIMALTALANLTGQPRITAEVGRGASLTITPVSLDGASSAALDVDFNVSEESAPQSTESTPRKDLLDRVAEHKVNSHVRVESLKLFSISSFTMELQHPERGQPFPIIGQAWEAVFGQTPYLGKLFHFPDRLKTVDNRSAAIIRAVVVPTAMDLGLGLRMENDRIVDPAENATIKLNSMDQIEGKPHLFHRELMFCIEKAQTSNCLGDVKLSTTAADLKSADSP